MKFSQHSTGFTLMEMVILMAIIAIIAAVAMPNAGGYIDNNRMSAAASDMMAALQTGRSEAVGRNSAITLCTVNSSATGCAGDANWEAGWLLFVDEDADGAVDAGEEIIQYHEPIVGGVTLRGTAGVNGPITFFPSGRTSITSTQTLILCDHRGFGDDARGLVVSILGRASVMKAPATGLTTCKPAIG
jgi:type IV fimbrial biogenesis protein FimT